MTRVSQIETCAVTPHDKFAQHSQMYAALIFAAMKKRVQWRYGCGLELVSFGDAYDY